MSKLTDKQKLFVHEYLVDLNATQAAIRAGYSEDTASEMGYENLRKPQIAKLVQEKMDQRANKIDLTAEKVLEGILKIANVDIGEAYDDKGRLLPIKEIPEHVRKCIAGVKVFEEFEGWGPSRHKVGETRELKFWDKLKSLELLGRHLKLFTDKVEHSGDKENPVIVRALTPEEIAKNIRIARGQEE